MSKSLLFFRLQSQLHESGYQTFIRVTKDKMEKEIEEISGCSASAASSSFPSWRSTTTRKF